MTISRVQVVDSVAFGKKIAEWAKFESSRPASLEELKTQLADIAHIPDRIESFALVPGTLEHLVFKLPPKEMIEESERVIPGLANYPVPAYYYEKFMNPYGISNEDFLYSRIADYTVGQCM